MDTKDAVILITEETIPMVIHTITTGMPPASVLGSARSLDQQEVAATALPVVTLWSKMQSAQQET